MALLEVKDIKKNFGKTDVLKGISFELQKGEVLAIIGSSGSGKTTLLRCLNYLEVPDNGKIVVNSETVYDSESDTKYTEKNIRDLRLHFGLVFQSFNLFPQYTVLDTIMLAPKLKIKEAFSTEIRTFLCIVASAILIITLNVRGAFDSVAEALEGWQGDLNRRRAMVERIKTLHAEAEDALLP